MRHGTTKWMAAGAMGIALALAGCGGGGGSAMTEPDPTLQEMCEDDGGRYNADMSCTSAAELAAEAEADGITDAIADAKAAADALTAQSSDADVEAAEALITTADNLIRSAQHASSDETANRLDELGAVSTTVDMAETAITGHREGLERMALETAQMKASEAAMEAHNKATEARTAASRVAEILGANSQSAMDADAAATAAESAAEAAEAASMRAQEDTMSADAEAEQQTAETEQGKAEDQLVIAEELQRQANQFANNNEQRDLGNARDDAKMYADMAAEHYEAAKGKAADARAQARIARAAANKAMTARTDYANADKYADMAEAAATAAEAARDTAEMAKNAAMAAYNAAMADTVAADAQAEASTAKAQNVIATAQHTGDDGAGMKYMAAKDAAMKAEMAADVHVLGLLLAANAADIEDLATTPNVDENAEAIMPFATAVGTAAAATGNGSGGTRATATWPAVPNDPDTDADESEDNVLTVTVAPEGGTPLTFRTEAIEDDPETDGTDESMPKTATVIGGLDDFMHGYSITDGSTHAIVFTDKMPDKAPVTAVTAVSASNLVNDPVSGSTVTDLGTRSGTGYTGVTYYDGLGTVDDDTDTNLAFTGSLTCPAGTACSSSTAANGDISVEGYVFTGSREETVGVTAMTAEQQATANVNYLTFGVWLQEDGDGSGTPQFGAFAAAGNAVTADTYGGAVVTGTARYEGDAAGVYTQGSSVDYFQGSATLTAKFGDAPETGDDTDLGTITGTIHTIMAGGVLTGDVIHLNDGDSDTTTSNISATGAITGDARMDFKETVDDVTSYHHNGSWSGQFYNGTADDDDTANVDESHVAPGSVAGTFGVTGTVGEGAAAVTTSYVGAFGAEHKP